MSLLHSPPTGYARLDRRSARGVLLLMLLGTIWFVYAACHIPQTAWSGRGTCGQGDIALFRAIVDRMQQGDGYYAASADEMTARGYPTRSLFNWRMPLPLWLLGRLPDPVLGKALLILLALAAAAVSFEALAREGRAEKGPVEEETVPICAKHPSGRSGKWRLSLFPHQLSQAVIALLLLGGPLMFCLLGDLFVMPVLWCGVLLVLSLGCYRLNRPRWSAALGLAALAVRELAMPYCLLMLALALWQRRRGEVLVWLIGLGAWSAYFALHAWNVQQAMPADGLAHTRGWIRFGGLSFLLATTRMNAYLMAVPPWATALYLAAGLFGFAGWNTPWGQRVGLTACLYAVAFAVVGQEFNAYWGCVVAPLWCLGVARLPASLRDAWQAASLCVDPKSEYRDPNHCQTAE